MMISMFDLACRTLGVSPELERSESANTSFASVVSETLVEPRFLNVEIVIRLNGTNPQGKPIWSYFMAYGDDVARMFQFIRECRGGFNPSDYGIVVAAGRDVPPLWMRHLMEVSYNMIDM